MSSLYASPAERTESEDVESFQFTEGIKSFIDGNKTV